MSVKDQIESVNRIENEFDVSQLKYQGIRIWPVIRAFLQLEKLIKSVKSRKAGPVKGFQSAVQTFRRVLQSGINYYWKDRQNSQFSLEKADLLFVFDMLPKVKNAFDGSWMNKFTCGIFPHVDPSKSSFYIEYSLINQFKTPRDRRSYYLNPSYFRFLLKSKLASSNLPNEIEGFQALQAFITEKGIPIRLEENVILLRLKKIWAFKQYFAQILEQVQPKVAIYPVYFSNLNFGLTLACKEAGIKTVELQHGQQGFYNITYSHWANYPSKPYLLHPDAFWMWSEENCKRINNWAANSSIEVFNGGNPWINFYKTKVFKQQKHLGPLESLKSDSRTKILVATQLPDDFLNGFLPGLMKENHPNLLWLIRLHPDQRGHEGLIHSTLSNLGCSNFEMQLASDAPLYNLFEVVDFNVTFWSTVAYEAELFGVNNIIAHEHGHLSMRKFIDDGVFAAASNGEEFMHAIEHFKFQKPKSNYIDSDDRIILKGLSEVYRLAQSAGN